MSISEVDQQRYMVFRVDSHSYAIGLGEVREVVAMRPLVEVDFSPEYFRGILNLRGSVISVVDLRQCLVGTDCRRDTENAIIILNIGDNSVGLLVESVEMVVEIKGNLIEDPEQVEKAHGNAYINGLTQVGDEFIRVLDYRKLMEVHHQFGEFFGIEQEQLAG